MNFKSAIIIAFSIFYAHSLFAIAADIPTPFEGIPIFSEVKSDPKLGCSNKLTKEEKAVFLSKKDVQEVYPRYFTEGGRPTTYNVTEVTVLGDSATANCEVPPHFMESAADPRFYLTHTTAFQLLEQAAKAHFDSHLKNVIKHTEVIQFASMHTGSFTFNAKRKISEPITGLTLFLLKKEIIPSPITPNVEAYSYTWLYDLGNGAINGEATFSFTPISEDSTKSMSDSGDTRRVSDRQFIETVRRLGPYRLNRYQNPVTRKITLRLEKIQNGELIESEKVAIDQKTGLIFGNTEEALTIAFTFLDYAAKKSNLYKTSAIFIDANLLKLVNGLYKKHTGGDTFLKVIGEVIQKNIRKTDIAIRIGGDEFLILLDQADEAIARDVSKKIATQISEHPKLKHSILELNKPFFEKVSTFVSKFQTFDQFVSGVSSMNIRKTPMDAITPLGLQIENTPVGEAELAFGFSAKAIEAARTNFPLFKAKINKISTMLEGLSLSISYGTTLISTRDVFDDSLSWEMKQQKLSNIATRAEKDPAYNQAKEASGELLIGIDIKDLRWIETPFTDHDKDQKDDAKAKISSEN